MKLILPFLKSVFAEIIILFLFILVINNYIGNVKQTIRADGEGYYDYLPSLFIHHDLVRKDHTLKQDSLLYSRIGRIQGYVDYHDHKVNKYPCGTAILESPFFLLSWLTTDREKSDADGYQWPFQKMIFYAAIFYLFLALFFFKKTLELYGVKKIFIFIAQLFLVLSTSVTHYANQDAGFSHIYSLFAITTCIYFTRSFFIRRNLNHFIAACLFFGLILILRQINFLLILILPFIAGSGTNFKEGLLLVIGHPKKLIPGLIAIAGVFFIQCVAWYLQTGSFFLYSYQGESFDLLKPHLFKMLFSYQKGLFVYAPILFIALSSLVWLTFKRKYYLVLTWLFFFFVMTYILSSWHQWEYGCSYGSRVYIDYYAIFFIPFALMLDGARMWLKVSVVALSLLTIPVNIIQTYQYKMYILSWMEMDKDKYWKVFLRTEERFQGMTWKRKYNYSYYKTVKEVRVSDFRAEKNSYGWICQLQSKAVPDFDKVSIVQVLVDNDFDAKNASKIILSIFETGGKQSFYWYDPYLLQFSEKKLNDWQTGLFNFEFSPLKDTTAKTISLELKSGTENNLLKNIRIRFLCQKNSF